MPISRSPREAPSCAHAPDAGEIELDGRPYRPADPHDARLKGVAMIYQELNLALHLPAWENITLGAESARAGWIDRRAAAQESVLSIVRAGADTVLTYFATDLARWWREDNGLR